MTLAEFARDWIAPGMAILAIITGVLGPLYSIVLAVVIATRDFRQSLQYWLYVVAFLLIAALAWSSMMARSTSVTTFIVLAGGAVVLEITTTVIMTRVFFQEYHTVNV